MDRDGQSETVEWMALTSSVKNTEGQRGGDYVHGRVDKMKSEPHLTSLKSGYDYDQVSSVMSQGTKVTLW